MATTKKEERHARIMEIGEWYMANNLPVTRVVAEHFNVTNQIASDSINEYFKLKKIGISNQQY